MVKCNYCGEENTGYSRFCNKCGNPLELHTQNVKDSNIDRKEDIKSSTEVEASTGRLDDNTNSSFSSNAYTLQPKQLSPGIKIIGGIFIFAAIILVSFFLIKFFFYTDHKSQKFESGNNSMDTSQSASENNLLENRFDTTSVSSNSANEDLSSKSQSSHADETLLSNVYDPEKDIFDFISTNTWRGKMASTDNEWTLVVELRYNRSGKIILELEPCTSELTYKDFKQRDNNEMWFLFYERITRDKQNCTAGLVSITASSAFPDVIRLTFYDTGLQVTAEGHLERI